MRMSSFKISFKRNSQFKQEDFFIRKDKNKIRTLGGAEYVRGYSRARKNTGSSEGQQKFEEGLLELE